MIFKLNYRTHLSLLSWSIPIIIIANIYAFINFNISLITMFYGILFWVLIFGVSWYKHIEYYFKNKGIVFEISKNEIILDKKGIKKVYKINDIKVIEICRSYTGEDEENTGFVTNPFRLYFFVRLVTVNEEIIILTCLLTRQIDKIIMEEFKGEVNIKRVPFFFSCYYIPKRYKGYKLI